MDELVYGLGEGWLGEGEYTYITLLVLGVLWFYPLYRFLKDKRKPIVDAAHVAYVFIPVSVWYLIQLAFNSSEPAYWIVDNLFLVILDFTLLYSFILVVLWLDRPRIDHGCKSFLLQDKPIQKEVDDNLGFKSYVDSIASNIRNITRNEKPYVFAVEGCWGSGKTSFINMVKEKFEVDAAINIVDFNPWMSSNSQQMTSDFFSCMAENVSDLRLKSKFREYGSVLSDFDGTGIIGKVVDRFCPEQDLGTMLDSLNECIKRHDLRFVVFIDDMDRLDKEEIMAVLKLVRNTAGFYQTIFVLAYDRSYVDAQLRLYFKSNSIADSYIDKIVDVQCQVPSSTSTVFELLIKTINNSEVVETLPHLKIDSNYNEDIKRLFTTLRQVKRVHNTIAIERELPHLNTLSFKYAIVFYFLQFYRIEEYNILREEFVNYITFGFKNRRSLIPILGEPQKILAAIKERKDVIHQIKDLYVPTTNEDRVNYDDVIFNKLFCCTTFLLENKSYQELKEQFNYLFKINAVDYKKTYGVFKMVDINGLKGIGQRFTNRREILERLLVLRGVFSQDKYEACVKLMIDKFMKKSSNEDVIDDHKEYLQFVIALLLNSNKPSEDINRFFNMMADKTVSVDSFYELLQNVVTAFGSSKDYYYRYYSKFSFIKRCDFVSDFISEITKKTNEDELFYHLFKVKNTECIIWYLDWLIKRNLSYRYVDYAFISCAGVDDKDSISSHSKINPEIRELYWDYIEKMPDEFVSNCIKDFSKQEGINKISFHPFLMQIFSNDKVEVRKYFNNVVCNTPKSLFMLDVIRKYLETYLSNEVQSHEFLSFSVEEDDYDKIFSYSDEDGEVIEVQPEPLQQTLLS